MGNETSHPFSDGEDGPQYRYHEAVLRDAHNRMLSPSRQDYISPPEAYLSDDEEQFYSAEEGDSSRSITPERTRPESSSGEDLVSDDEEGEVSIMSPPPAHSCPVQNRMKLRAQRSCGQCNVSAYHEQDSIGPELIATLQNSPKGSTNRGFTSSQVSHGNRNSLNVSNGYAQSPAKKMRRNVDCSPFQPIGSPTRSAGKSGPVHSSVMSNSLSPGKRKKQSGDGGDDVRVVPAKRILIRNSVKRKRLGYFDSSESEDEQTHNTPCCTHKKTKLRTCSVKKQSRPDRKSDDSDSDQDRYGKARRDGTSQCGKDDDENWSDMKQRRDVLTGDSNAPSRTVRQAYNDSVEDEEDSYVVNTEEVKQRLEVHDANSSGFGRLQQHRGDNAEHTNFSQTDTVSLVPQEASLPLCNDQIFAKMGPHAVRNKHGKVVYIRHTTSVPGERTTVNSATPDIQTNVLNTPLTSHIAGRLRPTSGAFLALQGSPPRNRLLNRIKRQVDSTISRHADGGDILNDGISSFVKGSDDIMSKDSGESNVKGKTPDNQSNTALSSGKTPDNQSNTALSPLTTTNDCSSSDPPSPFKGVVLTPPSAENGMHIINTFTESNGAKRSYQDIEGTKESDTPMDTDVDNDSRVNTRTIAKAKRQPQRKTTAERFRNFWSSKNNIGSNIKSFFAKAVGSSPRSQPTIPNTTLEEASSIPQACNLSEQNVGTSNIIHETSPVSLSSHTSNQSSPLTSSVLSSQSAPEHSSLPISPGSLVTRSASFIALSSSPPTSTPKHASLPTLTYQDRAGSALSNIRVSPRLRSRSAASAHTPCLIVENLPLMQSFQVLHVRLFGQVAVSVSLGEVTDTSLPGIVNYTDGELAHTLTACSRAVAARAGASLKAGCSQYLKHKGGPLEAPDVLPTPAGGTFNNGVDQILHVVAPVIQTSKGSPLLNFDSFNERTVGDSAMIDDGDAARNTLAQVYTNCLRFAEGRLKLHGLALPLIGSDKFPLEVCVQCFLDSIIIFLNERQNQQQPSTNILSTVHLIIPDAATADFVVDRLELFFTQLSSNGDLSISAAEASQRFAATESSPTVSSSGEIDGRALSGRPRMKRRRL